MSAERNQEENVCLLSREESKMPNGIVANKER